MNNITELVFILDKSGSMCGLESDTIGGYNALIKKQKVEEGNALVSTILFSDDIKVIHDRVNLKEIKPLTDKEYYIEGCTALLDAMGKTINHIKYIHKNLKEEAPSKTLFVITTDGLENASREYTYQNVKTLIESQKECGWEFIFLGANIDAAKEASKFGIEREKAVQYNCDEEGIAVNYEALSDAVKCMRTTGSLDKKWRKAIDQDYQKRKK